MEGCGPGRRAGAGEVSWPLRPEMLGDRAAGAPLARVAFGPPPIHVGNASGADRARGMATHSITQFLGSSRHFASSSQLPLIFRHYIDFLWQIGFPFLLCLYFAFISSWPQRLISEKYPLISHICALRCGDWRESGGAK